MQCCQEALILGMAFKDLADLVAPCHSVWKIKCHLGTWAVVIGSLWPHCHGTGSRTGVWGSFS